MGTKKNTKSPTLFLTDMGNAQRFAQDHNGREPWLRYVYDWRSWIAWDGRRWTRDAEARVMRAAKSTVRTIYSEAAQTPDDEIRQQIVKWAVRSESRPLLLAMTDLAKSEPGIAVTPKELDADLWLLNVENGTLDLRAGELRPHDRADLITKMAPVAYNPSAQCSRWLAFLDRIFDHRQDLIRWMQKLCGYSLTGDISEHMLPILWGGGANGKTTFLKTLQGLLGEDYACSIRPESLMVKRRDGIPNDIARLRGMRLVVSTEGNANQRLAEGLVKQLTGGDKMTARFMRAEFFDFESTHKIFFATNHRPDIRGTDHAIWRRVRLVPFTITIPESEQDRMLLDKLRAEYPGILNWLLEGCRAWLAEGLGDVPEEIKAATTEYRQASDVVGLFVAERCQTGPEARVRTTMLVRAYAEWAGNDPDRELSGKDLRERLVEQGFTTTKAHGHPTWIGIGLLDAAAEGG